MKNKTVGLLATLGLLLSACGASSSDPGGGGFGEAIAVHGNWTIDVLNPDGTLDEHVEFENAFTGAEGLSLALSQSKRMDRWRLLIAGSVQLCDDGIPNCSLPTEMQDGSPGPSTVSHDPATDEVVVSGSFIPDNSGDVTGVAGGLELCDVLPEGHCGVFYGISNHVFDPIDQVAVAAGQTVQVEVRYSFG